MARRERLFSYANALLEKGIILILVQIEEAHTNAWPIGKEYQPDNHKSQEDRVNQALLFIEEYQPPFPVYVDDFNTNEYENTFHSWPDKYYMFDRDFKVLERSDYHQDPVRDGLVILDVVDLLEKMINDPKI